MVKGNFTFVVLRQKGLVILYTRLAVHELKSQSVPKKRSGALSLACLTCGKL